jgi:hypothetical protein
VGLGDFALRRVPTALSGGQSQRVAIARALVAANRAWWWPTNRPRASTPAAGEEVMEVFARVSSRDGRDAGLHHAPPRPCHLPLRRAGRRSQPAESLALDAHGDGGHGNRIRSVHLYG